MCEHVIIILVPQIMVDEITMKMSGFIRMGSVNL